MCHQSGTWLTIYLMVEWSDPLTTQVQHTRVLPREPPNPISPHMAIPDQLVRASATRPVFRSSSPQSPPPATSLFWRWNGGQQCRMRRRALVPPPSPLPSKLRGLVVSVVLSLGAVARTSGWKDCVVSPEDRWKPVRERTPALRMRYDYERRYTCINQKGGWDRLFCSRKCTRCSGARLVRVSTRLFVRRRRTFAEESVGGRIKM